jgi:hypothetical protein
MFFDILIVDYFVGVAAAAWVAWGRWTGRI